MASVPLAQAKNQLSELIGRVERGETIAVTKRGKPVIQMVPFSAGASDRQQRKAVQQTFDRLRELRKLVVLEGDIKSMGREGLD